MKKKRAVKEEPKTLYHQLAFEFGEAIVAGEDDNGDREFLLSPARQALAKKQCGHPFSRSAIADTLRDFIPGINRWERCFDNMEEAEDRIYQGFKKYPDRVKIIDRVFPALYSTSVLESAGYNTYVLHIVELIQRVGEGDTDLTQPTHAEVIAAIHGMTLITPVGRFVGQAYWKLFQELLPYKSKVIRDDMEPFFGWPSYAYDQERVLDFIERLRKKLIVNGRELSSIERRCYTFSLTAQRFFFNNRKHAPKGFFQSEEAARYAKYHQKGRLLA